MGGIYGKDFSPFHSEVYVVTIFPDLAMALHSRQLWCPRNFRFFHPEIYATTLGRFCFGFSIVGRRREMGCVCAHSPNPLSGFLIWCAGAGFPLNPFFQTPDLGCVDIPKRCRPPFIFNPGGVAAVEEFCDYLRSRERYVSNHLPNPFSSPVDAAGTPPPFPSFFFSLILVNL